MDKSTKLFLATHMAVTFNLRIGPSMGVSNFIGFLLFSWYQVETLSGVYKFELVRYICMYICMEVRVP